MVEKKKMQKLRDKEERERLRILFLIQYVKFVTQKLYIAL